MKDGCVRLVATFLTFPLVTSTHCSSSSYSHSCRAFCSHAFRSSLQRSGSFTLRVLLYHARFLPSQLGSNSRPSSHPLPVDLSGFEFSWFLLLVEAVLGLSFVILNWFFKFAMSCLSCVTNDVMSTNVFAVYFVGLYCSMASLTVVVIRCSTVLLNFSKMSSSPFQMLAAATLHPMAPAVLPVIRSMSLMLFFSAWKNVLAFGYVCSSSVFCFHTRSAVCRKTLLL